MFPALSRPAYSPIGANSLVVTHPFHPLAGQTVLILSEYRSRAVGRVYVCGGGALGHVALPEAFTDRGLPPAPRPVTAEILADVAAVVAALRKP
jgi:Family of unknown function (DUF5372)